MKTIIRLFIFTILLLTLNVSAETTPTTDKNKYLVDEQPAQIGYACPAVKEKYDARVYSIDYWSATTICLIFDRTSKQVVDKVSYTNPALYEQNTKLSAQIKENATKSAEPDKKSVERYNALKNIKENYSDSYLGGSKIFLNAPHYLIAGLTLDNKIIDIKNTVSSNAIQLQSDYTLFPNSYLDYSADNHYIGTIGVIKGMWNSLWSDDEAVVEKNNYERLSNSAVMITSHTKDMLTNSIIFVIQFFNHYNPILLELKSYLLFITVPITLLFLLSNKVTKKLSNIRDNDDILERALMTIVALFVFYFSTATIEVPSDGGNGKISQVSYHGFYRSILNAGSTFADKVSYATLDAYMLYKFRDVGMVSQQNINDLEAQKILLKTESDFLNIALKVGCYDVYDTVKTREQVQLVTGLDLMFPPTENQTQFKIEEKEFYVTWYTNDFLKIKDISPSFAISGCANIFKNSKELKAKLTQVNDELSYIKIMQSDSVANEKLTTLAKTQYRNFGELGWIALPMLASLDNALDELELITNFSNKLKNDSERFAIASEGNVKVEGNANMTSEIDSAMLNNLPYIMIPFLGNLKSELATMMHIPVLSSLVPQISNTGAFWASVAISKFFIGMLPSIVVLTSSILIIGYWLISILIYYIVTPFLLAFALATTQTEVIKKYLLTGVILAFKPLILVVSIVIAMFAIEFLTNLNSLLLDWSFGNVQELFSKVDFNLAFLIMLKEFLHILNTIVISIFGFYLIFNGSDIILNIFGVKDINLDIQTSVGDKIDGKSSKYSM